MQCQTLHSQMFLILQKSLQAPIRLLKIITLPKTCRQIYAAACQIKTIRPQASAPKAPLKTLSRKGTEKMLKCPLRQDLHFKTMPTKEELPPQKKPPPTQTVWSPALNHHATVAN